MHHPLLQEPSPAAYYNQFPGLCTAFPGGHPEDFLEEVSPQTQAGCYLAYRKAQWIIVRLNVLLADWTPGSGRQMRCLGTPGLLQMGIWNLRMLWGVGGRGLPSCLMAEPGQISGRQPVIPCLRPPLCVSHHLEVALICFNLAGVGSSWEYCHRLVLPSTVASCSSRKGGGVQSALQ